MTDASTAPVPAGAPEAAPAPAAWLPLAAAGVTLVMWASAFVVIRHVADDISPGALSVGRLVIAALAVAPWVFRTGWVSPTRREWLLLLACGVGWFGIYNLTLNAGEHRIDAGTAALIIQVGPILTAVLATVLFDEVMHRWLIAGMVVGFSGVALIARGFSSGGDGDLLGVGLVLIAALMYSVGVLTQKPLLRRIPGIQVVFVSFVVGAVVCVPFAGDLPRVLADPGATLGWVAYLGIFPTAIAFTTWAYALSHSNAGALSLTTFLVPVLTTLIAWGVLGEVPPAWTFVGGALAITGVLLTRVRPRSR